MTAAPTGKVTGLVLTGFLGAGKTTLLNRLLAARAAGGGDGGKLGIIVNELGSIGVDGDLLPTGAARQVELPGGCICCMLDEDLDRTVIEILDANPDIDTLVIETTGVAEPVPIVWSLERPPVSDRLRVAAIVTVVDPTSFAGARAASNAADIQVESADVVLLSKLDVARPAEVTQARGAIATLAPAAPVVDGSADQQVAWLQDILRDPERRTERTEIGQGQGHGHGHGPEAGHAHGAAHGIDSVALRVDQLVDLEELEDALGELPTNYVRVKGIVRAVDPRTGDRVPRWSAVHRVGLRVSSEVVGAPRDGGRIVALGRDVMMAPLAACLARAVLSS
ncbi:MAG TPA: GTP-binding protein [Kofleriaceae bacterium]|nr:GTP-binding protein [Kofleriaceae bacterium]